MQWCRMIMNQCIFTGLCVLRKQFSLSHLIHNIVQKFKDGHGWSTVHPMACREGAENKLRQLSKLLQWKHSVMWSLTAHGSARWSGPLHISVSLPLGPIHNRPSEDAFQLFSVWWGDGVSADGQLHEGQPHAPHVRLNRVVSALQSLRLLENRQSMSERQVEPRCLGGKRAGQWPGRERDRKWMRGRMAEEGKVGGNMARRVGEWWEPKVRWWEGLAGGPALDWQGRFAIRSDKWVKFFWSTGTFWERNGKKPSLTTCPPGV